MKLPRWLLISLLTANFLATLTTAAGWWITWPKRTAREFVSLVAAGRIDDATRLMQRGDDYEMIGWRRNAVWLKDAGLEPQSRTCLDVLQGRETFSYGNILFRTERGRVITLSTGVDLPYTPMRSLR